MEEMESNFRSLFRDPDCYVKCLDVFSPLTAKFSTLPKWIDGAFSEAVVANLGVTLGEQEQLRVMGVGSGSGEVDVEILTKVLERFPRINNRVVEPAQAQLVQYKALVQAKADELQGVSFDWRQQTIEQYEKAGDMTKFHFISAVDSFYYVDNVESSLMYLYDLLEPGGIMLVVVATDDNGFLRLWNRFPSLHENFMRHISSAHIRSHLDGRGIPYTRYSLPGRAEITKCFEEPSEDGKLIVDFLTHVQNFKETAPEDLQREVMEYLASADCSERSGDEILFIDNTDAVVVSKPSALL